MRLSIAQMGQDLLLLAPPWATNAVLEYSSDMTAGSWMQYHQPIDLTNGLVIVNPSPGTTFYRIRSP